AQRRREQRLQQQAARQADIERQRQQQAERSAEIERERRQQRAAENAHREQQINQRFGYSLYPRYHRSYDYFQRAAEERQHEEYIRSRLPDFDEGWEETIQDQLLDVYDYEKMDPEERWNQDMLNHLEGFVDLQLLAIQQEEIEEMQRLDEAENYGE
ncbi:unnamed protein product, partial [Rotaria sp. Silwood2]